MLIERNVTNKKSVVNVGVGGFTEGVLNRELARPIYLRNVL
jgi:hypothetical protein